MIRRPAETGQTIPRGLPFPDRPRKEYYGGSIPGRSEAAVMLDVVKAIVPRAVRTPVRRALDFAYSKATRSWTARAWVCDVHDACDWVLGRSDPLVPPRKLVVGIGGELRHGDHIVAWLRDLAGLTPDEAVLDVGCGVGRVALPLTRYLSPAGRYDGFDIVRDNVAWCRRSITPRFPNFRFRHADIFNREYNPRGRLSGSTYRFPYPDRSFDLVFLTSVFTHLMPADAAHYLGEIARVLRPGGRCLATFFLLNAESTALVDAGKSHFTLVERAEHCRYHSREVPEACIALDEDYILNAVKSAGLEVGPPVRYGWWCGRQPAFDFQDIVLVRRAVQ
jgi:SAM-dependent methyltransferase